MWPLIEVQATNTGATKAGYAVLIALQSVNLHMAPDDADWYAPAYKQQHVDVFLYPNFQACTLNGTQNFSVVEQMQWNRGPTRAELALGALSLDPGSSLLCRGWPEQPGDFSYLPPGRIEITAMLSERSFYHDAVASTYSPRLAVFDHGSYMVNVAQQIGRSPHLTAALVADKCRPSSPSGELQDLEAPPTCWGWEFQPCVPTCSNQSV